MEIIKDATIIQRLSPIEGSKTVMKDYWINRPIKYYKKSMKSIYSKTVKCLMRSSETENPAWLYVNYDSHLFTYKAFHIEFQWFACDSWLVDELVTLMYRRCTRFGLRLVQTPSYFNSNNLNVHPYRPAPYIMIPNHYTTTTTSSSSFTPTATSLSSANMNTSASATPVASALTGIVTSGLTTTLSAPSTPLTSAVGGFNKSESATTSTSQLAPVTSTTAGSTSSSSNNILAGIPPLSTAVPLPSGPTVFTIPFVHSSALRLIERIYFIHSHDWMFDSEECTKWDLIGLNIPNYSDRDRDLYNDELLASYIQQPTQQLQGGGGLSLRGGLNASATSGSASSKSVNAKSTIGGGSGTPSLQKSMFRNKSGDEDNNSNVLMSGSNTPTNSSSSNLIGIGAVEKTAGGNSNTLASQSNEVIEGRTNRADSNVSIRGFFGAFDTSSNNAPPLPGPTGSIQSLLSTVKGKDRPENKRIDRQYVHVLGIATVRVAAQGFLWFSSSTTKISDMNMSIEDKTAISMKAMHQLELHCEIVNDIYEILLDCIDNTVKISLIHEILYDLIDEIESGKTPYQLSSAVISQTPSMNHSNTSSPSHSFYPRPSSAGGRDGWTTPKSPPIGMVDHSNGSTPSPYISPHSPQRSTSFRNQAVATDAGVILEGQSHSASFNAVGSPSMALGGKMVPSLQPNLNLDLELIHSGSMKGDSGFTFSNPMSSNILSSKASPTTSSGKRTTPITSLPGSNLVSPAPVKAYQQSGIPATNPLKLTRGKKTIDSSSSSSDDESHHTGTPVQLLYSSKDSREGSAKSLSNANSSSGRSTTLSPSLTPGVTPTSSHPPPFQPPSFP